MMLRRALLMLSCLAAAWPAAAVTYKCTVDGRTIYQQQPCPTAGNAVGGVLNARTAPVVRASSAPAAASAASAASATRTRAPGR
jgi:hypothetical protein